MEKCGERLGPGASRAATPGEDKPSGAREEGSFPDVPMLGNSPPLGCWQDGRGLLTVLDGLSEEHQLHGHHGGGQIVLAKRCLHGRFQGRQVRQVLVHLGLPHEVPWARGAGLRPRGPARPSSQAPSHTCSGRSTHSPKMGERLVGHRL